MATKIIKNVAHGQDHGHDNHHDHEEEVRKTDLYGFWLYLMTDCILFGSLFLVFLILGHGYPAYKFDMNLVMSETMLLLTSSFTFGMAVLGMYRKSKPLVFFWLALTFVLGAAFLVIEMYEFTHLYHEGKAWNAHAYYSAFFALVGTHGAHVFVGLLWMLALAIQIAIHGITPKTTTKILLLSLFWHFLDIIWIFVFSVVYLIGAL
jgi:cytochrome o ubiquinol oxidase subunit 3